MLKKKFPPCPISKYLYLAFIFSIFTSHFCDFHISADISKNNSIKIWYHGIFDVDFVKTFWLVSIDCSPLTQIDFQEINFNQTNWEKITLIEKKDRDK